MARYFSTTVCMYYEGNLFDEMVYGGARITRRALVLKGGGSMRPQAVR